MGGEAGKTPGKRVDAERGAHPNNTTGAGSRSRGGAGQGGVYRLTVRRYHVSVAPPSPV